MARERAAKCSIKLLSAALAHAPGQRCLPRPVPVGRVCAKLGGGTAAALRFSHVLRLSIIELGGNLGWSLFSEVVICLVFALL